jgi:DNA-binding MarR family transcriptional regulator
MKYYSPRSYTARSSIGYQMRRGALLMREQLEQATASGGFTFAQWITLVLVRDDASLTPGALCHYLHHDSGALTRLLDQLERQKYLLRERSASDRRVVCLRLTSAGRKVIDTLMPAVVDRLNSALEGFTAAEVKTLDGLLGRLIMRLEQTAADSGAAPRTKAGARR